MEAASLQMITELARSSRDAAAVRVAQLQNQLEKARAQLEVLLNYANDYQYRGVRPDTGAFDPAAQANLQAFVARLKTAVEAQQREVAHREKAVADAQEELQQMQRRFKSMETLGERQREHAQQVAARREQRTLDEIAQNSLRSKSNGEANNTSNTSNQSNPDTRQDRPTVASNW